MEVITQNPVLVNKGDIINGYTLNSEDNATLYGKQQSVSLGDIVVKGTNPVFSGNKEVSRNEFLFAEPVELEGETLTPNDEFLYSNAGGDLLGNPYSGKPTSWYKPVGTSYTTTKITPAQYSASVKDIPGGPSAAEQVDKAKKEGKFWNALKGSWDKFKTTENGQIIVQSGMALILSKLGGAGTTAPTTDTTPPVTPPADDAKPLSKTTKTILIVGGVAVLGLIIYSIVKNKS